MNPQLFDKCTNTIFYSDYIPSFKAGALLESSNQEIRSLIQFLKEQGPLVATGNFGPRTYKVEPTAIHIKVCKDSIYKWQKGAERSKKKQSNEILVVGALKTKKQALVFFRLPEAEKNAHIYVISHERFCEDLENLKTNDSSAINGVISAHSIDGKEIPFYEGNDLTVSLKVLLVNFALTEVVDEIYKSASQIMDNPDRIKSITGHFSINPIKVAQITCMGLIKDCSTNLEQEDANSLQKHTKLDGDQWKACINETTDLITNEVEIFKLNHQNRFIFNIHSSRQELINWKMILMDLTDSLYTKLGMENIGEDKTSNVNCFDYALKKCGCTLRYQNLERHLLPLLIKSGWKAVSKPKNGDLILYYSIARKQCSHAAIYLGDGRAESKAGLYNPYIYRHNVFDFTCVHGNVVFLRPLSQG